MKIRLTLEIFDGEGELLSKETREIVKLSEEMEKGARSGIKVEDYRKIDSFIEAKVLEAQMKKMKKVCECGEERDLKLNGLRNRQVKTLNNDLQLKVPKVYCHRCNKYSQMGKGLLPEGSNINQDLEKVVLELVPLTTSYESLSELLWKLRGIKISAKEIERIVIERGKQIKDLQTKEYERIDEVLKEIKPEEVDRLYISADGMYVHSAEEDRESFEGKFGVVYSDEVANVNKGRNLLLNKRYCGSFYGKEDFGELLNVTAYKMGLDTAKEVVYVCDGDRSLWKIKEEHFEEAKGILDWDHISRNLNKALRVIEDKGKRKRRRKKIKNLLWEGEVGKSLSVLKRTIREEEKLTPEDRGRLKHLVEFKGYIENNLEWTINYGQAREEGYYISSSIMESTINSIAANRLKKKRSRKWLRAGADSVSRIMVSIKFYCYY